MNDPINLQATHEVYGYIDDSGEPVEMTDPEPVRVYDDELYTPTGDCVGVCRDMYEKQSAERNCNTCHGTGQVNHAKNRHYEDWKPCHELKCRDGKVAYTTTGEASGAKRWVMPNHNTTLLLRRLPDQVPYLGDIPPLEEIVAQNGCTEAEVIDDEMPICGDPNLDDGAF